MQTITTLQQAIAVAKAQEVAALKDKGEIKNPRYTFKSAEFKTALDNLTTGTALDPVAEIKNFNAIVEARGYEFFSSDMMDDWRAKFGAVTPADIVSGAKQDTEQFIFSVQNPAHVEHNTNRLLFATQFDSNKENVRAFFTKKRDDAAGAATRVMKDTLYEQRLLTAKRIDSTHKAFELATMKNLFEAKHRALGYFGDDAYRARFLKDYCVALKAENF